MEEKAKHVIETTLNQSEIDSEDGGQALIFTTSREKDDDEMQGMFVRIQSWDEIRDHEEFNKFVGKKIRITIEEI